MEKNEIEVFAYMMACEKMVSLIDMIEQTTEFLDEYKIKPDEAVKKTLLPLLEKLAKWAKEC